MRLNPRIIILLGFVLSLLLSAGLHRSVFPLEIQGIHNWRQSQTMWNVYNFVHQDNDILNPRVSHFNGSNDNLLRYEFPVMQWTIAQLVRVTGREVLVARLVVWLIGVAGLAGFYLLLRTMGFSRGISLVGTVLLEFSPVFYFYTVNVLPDLLALAAGIWYLHFSFAYFRDRRAGQLVAAAALLCLATLAKLPFALFGIVGVVYFFRYLWARGRVQGRLVGFAVVHLLLIAPAVAWYAWVMPNWTDNPIIYGIFASTNSRADNLWILKYYMKQYVPYDLLSPATWALMILGIAWPARRSGPVTYRAYVWAVALLSLLYVALQWNTITTVHDYYLLPLLPWMYIVVTAGAGRLYQLTQGWGAPAVAYLLLAAAVIASPWYAYHLRQRGYAIEQSYRYDELQDVMNNAAELRAAAPDDATVIVVNDNAYHIFTWLIRKKGYVFSADSVQPLWIKDMIDRNGATYLYSTSRKVDENPDAAPFLDSLVLSRGNVRVYRLADPE